MTEENTTPTPDYLKGFNEAYTLSQHDSELAEKLSSVKGESDRIQGFQDGRRQFVLDKARDLRPDWLKGKTQNRDFSNRDKTKGRDMDLE